jgi:hypothetical protein
LCGEDAVVVLADRLLLGGGDGGVAQLVEARGIRLDGLGGRRPARIDDERILQVRNLRLQLAGLGLANLGQPVERRCPQ